MKNTINILEIGDNMKYHIKVIILFVIVILMVMFIPSLNNEYIKTNKIYISEIMANNTYTLTDDDNDYSDYIEIYNEYGSSINLKNYYLSDDEFDTKKWKFPDIEIKSKEYLIIYASGKDKCDEENKICHTNFRLSSKGEVITLTDTAGNIINKFTYGKANNDISFGYKNGKYVYLNEPTPGKKNSQKLKTNNIKTNSVIFNEYMVHNQRNNYDNTGYYSDWLELYNSTDKDILLENIYLSDDETLLNKYKIPKVKIKSKDYLVIYLSGESKVIDNYIYANFKLGIEDQKIFISNGKKIIDEIDIVSLDDNISCGKYKNEWKYFTSPTPGYENNTLAFDSLGGNSGNS